MHRPNAVRSCGSAAFDLMSAALAASRAEPIATAVPRSSLPRSWRTRSRSVQGNCGGRGHRFRPPISASIQARWPIIFVTLTAKLVRASAEGVTPAPRPRTRARRLPLCLVGIRSDTHDSFVCGTTIAKRGAAHAARRVDLWEFVRTSAVRKHRVGSELSVTL